MVRIIAVIPAYNEEKRIAQAVKDAKAFCDEVVVVDDCSADKTGQVAFVAGAYVLRHVINRGQGAALQTATDFALQNLGADIIVHFDGDGQMMGSDIPKLVEPIVNDEADIVLGSRFLGAEATNMPWTRKVTLFGGRVFTTLISGIRLTDTHNGFRALSRDAAKKLRISLDRMAHASEIIDLIAVRNVRVVERPVTIRYTEETLQKGQSAMGAFRIVKDMLKKRFLG